MHCARPAPAFFHKKASPCPELYTRSSPPSPDTSFEQRSFHSCLALFSKPKRVFCTSSTDGAPRHGHHDVRSHGLDQGNGTVDGLSPAVKLLVKFEEGNCKETHPETLQLCSRRALRSSRSGNCHRWWTSFNAPIWTNPVKPNVSTKPNLISIIKDATHKLQRLP